MLTRQNNRELKKGSADLLILALIEDRARHGYDIGRQIHIHSKGALTYNVASLYPVLYRLERRGLIEGKWTEKAGERRRRLYRITADGRRVLAAQRGGWAAFARAVSRIAGVEM